MRLVETDSAFPQLECRAWRCQDRPLPREIVVKPISVTALVKRLAHVLQMPRRFIRDESFIGPDRRRLGERRHVDRRSHPLDAPGMERRQRSTRRLGKERRRPE